MRISQVVQRRLKVMEEVGSIDPAWSPGQTMHLQRGGGSFVEIRTDEGLIGIGPEIDDRFVPALNDLLTGKTLDDVETLSGMLDYYFPGGTHYQYIAGADIALWDLVGKIAGQPLYQLWGGTDNRVVPYASMMILSTPEERAEMAARIVGEGFQAMKLRLHHERMDDDIRTVQLVREAVGPDVKIMVDANQAQSKGGWQPAVRWDLERAQDTARALVALDCTWLEEPLPRYALDDLRRLREETGIRLSGGENNPSLFDFEQMCAARAYDVLQPEVLVLTGITETRKVGALAAQHGLEVAPHNGYVKLGHIAHMHMVASWPHARFLELMYDPPVGHYMNFLDILTQPPQVSADGFTEVPTGPGLGVDINPDYLLDD